MAKNKVQCPYGHFYNADKYTGCPTCNPGLISSSGVASETAQKKVTTASRSKFTKSECPLTSHHPTSKFGTFSPTESVFGNQYEGNRNTSSQTKRTESLFSSGEPETSARSSNQEPPTVEPQIVDSGETVPPPSSLQAAVDSIIAHKDTEDIKTVAMWNAPAGSDPVVGWLVCVSGEYFGQSFNLKTGNNSVGRAMNMDIPLAQEPSVSRNKHCMITYEPQSQVFYIQQGESSGLTYLNGDMVMTPTKMKLYDRIKLGKAELMLIPFCAQGFRWEGYVDQI